VCGLRWRARSEAAAGSVGRLKSRAGLADHFVVDHLPSSAMRRRLAPFAGATLLGLGLGLIGSRVDVGELGVSVVLTVALFALALTIPWPRVPTWRRALPAFGYLLAIGILRDAAGGAGSGLSALMLLPIFWLALYGTRAQLVAMLLATAVALYAPFVLIGAPAYPASMWRGGALFVVVGAIIGFTVYGLIARLRALLAERTRLIEELEALAGTDPLTGVPNRRSWDDALERALAAARRSGEPLSVLVFDVDHFKRLNDEHGHQHGDRVLKAIAASWAAELRPADLLARIGGEEFAALLPSCDAATARSVAERLRHAMPMGTTSSAGVAQWDGIAEAAALLAAADDMLYEAKQAGRDRTMVAPARERQ
jgi:diguanylate cyclase (GGDEF)-like protein